MSRRRFAALVLNAAGLSTLAGACGSDGGRGPKASSTLSGGDIVALAYGADGKTLFAGDDVGQVFAWDPASHGGARGQQTTVYPEDVNPPVGGIAVGGDGSFLAVAARTLEIWDAARLTRTERLWAPADGPLRSAPQTWVGKNSDGLRYSTAVAVSPDGATVVDGLYGGTVRVWDRKTGKQTAELPDGTDLGAVDAIAFSSDGKRVAAAFAAPTTGPAQGATMVWDLASRQKTCELSVSTGDVLFRPDGGLCASTVKGVMFLDRSGTVQGAPFTDSPRAIALSPDGAVLALGNGPEDDRVQLWDAATRRLLRTFKAAASVSTLTFDPSGRTLAVGTGGGTVQLWDVGTG